MPLDRGQGRSAERPTFPVAGMEGRVRLRAVLAAIGIALIATALCAAVGLLLAQAFFGTTGGIL